MGVKMKGVRERGEGGEGGRDGGRRNLPLYLISPPIPPLISLCESKSNRVLFPAPEGPII